MDDQTRRERRDLAKAMAPAVTEIVPRLWAALPEEVRRKVHPAIRRRIDELGLVDVPSTMFDMSTNTASERMIYHWLSVELVTALTALFTEGQLP